MNDLLSFCQYWEDTDLPSSAAVKSRGDCHLFEGCVLTKHELV